MHYENHFILILYKQQLRSNFKAPSMHFKANLVYRVENSVEASITKLTFYHIKCFLLSKDAFTTNLAEFGPDVKILEPSQFSTQH